MRCGASGAARECCCVEGDPDCRSAGSFFKNPSVTEEVAERVRKIAADTGVSVRIFPADDGLVKIPAAWLIEQAGFAKGYMRWARREFHRGTRWLS